MEHVEGKPLSALIPADGLPPESVIRYGTQIADNDLWLEKPLGSDYSMGLFR